MEDRSEIRELESEISRHHRDFVRISQIVHRALEEGPEKHQRALERIRNLVG